MDRERLILLHHCRGVTWKVLNHFVALGSLETVFQLTSTDVMELTGMKRETSDAFIHDRDRLCSKEIQHFYHKHDIHIHTMTDEKYPPLLKQIYDPPWVLYTKGNQEVLNNPNTLGVVGTRHPTREGQLSLQRVVTPLINDGWVIVSGLAIGMDTQAHELTVRNDGSTMAVLGSGLGCVYPKQNEALALRITHKGVLVTEYPYLVQPQKWHFPQRNRIISGLSRGVLVTEAKEKSGSLITADQAMEQGRDVFALPGSLLNEYAHGTNRLIQEGAKLVLGAQDILDELTVKDWAKMEY
ncbi:Rossmann fold nucleotide-binding protein involved in DNA uptake [Fictibacillus macauensis ZFHKF-1]|uniref:Rossmann fold nucleotide-binding protein involved in DNA uptake n=1 Tax=Fictibacillus macauensis ZFHKF-1 TaxID=1196324 RepID=I8UDT8_9BACL|nr:DNA-processing protein DprA [Fictibacillus macauensis]EIT85070.1 Rossmann fold nucleotide-binding protein involved in DNA uptake [Fictibacillus macauensis ZFHKF-1]